MLTRLALRGVPCCASFAMPMENFTEDREGGYEAMGQRRSIPGRKGLPFGYEQRT
jgi:hypothetical protein